MAADSLKRIGDKICQDYLGFNPTLTRQSRLTLLTACSVPV